jgi:hypothetical protein
MRWRDSTTSYGIPSLNQRPEKSSTTSTENGQEELGFPPYDLQFDLYVNITGGKCVFHFLCLLAKGPVKRYNHSKQLHHDHAGK